MLKVGIIGCGCIFTMHATSCDHLENATLVGVCDIKKDRADAAAEKYKVNAYYDYKELIEKEKPGEIVLGLPINMDGTRGPRSEKAQSMKALLEQTLPLPVTLWDERRTTIDAHQILFNSGKNAKQRKKVVDAVAASLILEGYLTFKKSH